jgi:hypothetical protein
MTMRTLDTPVFRATVGAGLLLACGLVGRGVLPEQPAQPPAPTFDPGGSVVMTTAGDETVTIHGVELSGIGALWSGLLEASGADLGIATDRGDEAARGGHLGAATRMATARFMPPDGLAASDTSDASAAHPLPHLPALAGHPGGGRSDRPGPR